MHTRTTRSRCSLKFLKMYQSHRTENSIPRLTQPKFWNCSPFLTIKYQTTWTNSLKKEQICRGVSSFCAPMTARMALGKTPINPWAKTWPFWHRWGAVDQLMGNTAWVVSQTAARRGLRSKVSGRVHHDKKIITAMCRKFTWRLPKPPRDKKMSTINIWTRQTLTRFIRRVWKSRKVLRRPPFTQWKT